MFSIYFLTFYLLIFNSFTFYSYILGLNTRRVLSPRTRPTVYDMPRQHHLLPATCHINASKWVHWHMPYHHHYPPSNMPCQHHHHFPGDAMSRPSTLPPPSCHPMTMKKGLRHVSCPRSKFFSTHRALDHICHVNASTCATTPPPVSKGLETC
jgi:hypothetical protein